MRRIERERQRGESKTEQRKEKGKLTELFPSFIVG
jgi:hypothetical protein